MKPPRYILREYALLKLINKNTHGNFLEIGYGAGEMLLTLAKLGYTGDGFDLSQSAQRAAKELLRKNGVLGINLLDRIDFKKKYDLLLCFEVVGYFTDPVAQLSQYRELIKHKGEIIFSFTNSKNKGYAEKATGEMKCFTRDEIKEILHKAGLTIKCIWNYGFPLTNMMKPVLNIFHFFRNVIGEKASKKEALRESGLGHKNMFMKAVGIVINPITLYPFALLQLLFRHSDLGTGYVVVARKQ
jgi:SAM-dependent methyltransferase